ncbi:MAG: hypothetical protein KBB37_00275 [Bacteroidia bacterium]|nr:hypothetical protein [Bacteroidia bacterium]MBP7259694.1 hypothetical protein [Bacteroidia bacterium]MBP9179391.1 hypothetical protein [Bacteroidia bacterium]MBP9723355.1 hypothetical protein [Bacteroidia bacterium]
MLQFIKDHIEIIAIISSPVIAFYVGFLHNRATRKRNDKKYVFSTLFQLRAHQGYSEQWVKALNFVPIAFYNSPKVQHALNSYLPTLKDVSTKEHEQRLLDLIFEMAVDLGYKKIKQTDINTYYLPTWLVNEMNRMDKEAAQTTATHE